MRINATNVLPGDRVRGIGLVVEYSEPQDDFNTTLEGHYSVPAEGGGYYQHPARITVPNTHRVNVVRSAENFLADRVADAEAALVSYRSDDAFGGDVDTLVTRLTEVGSRPRHAHVSWGDVYSLVDAMKLDEVGGELVVAKLDAVNEHGILGVLGDPADEATTLESPNPDSVGAGYPEEG